MRATRPWILTSVDPRGPMTHGSTDTDLHGTTTVVQHSTTIVVPQPVVPHGTTTHGSTQYNNPWIHTATTRGWTRYNDPWIHTIKRTMDPHDTPTRALFTDELFWWRITQNIVRAMSLRHERHKEPSELIITNGTSQLVVDWMDGYKSKWRCVSGRASANRFQRSLMARLQRPRPQTSLRLNTGLQPRFILIDTFT